MNEGNVTVLERAIEAWGRRDLEAYLKLYDADVVLHGLEPGLGAVREMYAHVWQAYPRSGLQLDDVISEGDKLACRYTWRATDTSTGEAFVVPGVTIMHFRDGKVRERWDFEGTERNVA